MKRIFWIWIIATIALGLGVILFAFIYVQIARHQAKVLFETVKNHDKRYVYETYYKALNPVFYVKDFNDTAPLISYYAKVEKHDTAAYITFEKNFMPLTLHQPIYVYKYLNQGSKIIELIDFDTNCWGYVKGYVYIPTTHVNAPPDSLVKKKELFERKQKSDKNEQLTNRIYKKINPYGWYCDD